MMSNRRLAFFLMFCIFLTFIGLLLLSWAGLLLVFWGYSKLKFYMIRNGMSCCVLLMIWLSMLICILNVLRLWSLLSWSIIICIRMIRVILFVRRLMILVSLTNKEKMQIIRNAQEQAEQTVDPIELAHLKGFICGIWCCYDDDWVYLGFLGWFFCDVGCICY